MTEYLFYCRSGYEADLLAELDDKLGANNHYGYASIQKDSAFLRYHLLSDTSSADEVFSTHGTSQSLTASPTKAMPPLSSLMFARQKCKVLGQLTFENVYDRVGEIINALSDMLASENQNQTITETREAKSVFGDLRVEYPDTENGKQMAKFCKKFTVPLRSALRQHGTQVNGGYLKNGAALLSAKPNSKLPYLHVFFEKGDACLLAVSFAHDRSHELLGIKRLKFPQDAPSRSTLKLEEAIDLFLGAEQSQLMQSGMTAVDLGACPGGWTYQLLKRGLKVEAVDNGAMDEKLMQSGKVSYHAADGFSYRPQHGHVDWLVCDMIEQPDRVATLMCDWFLKRQTSAAIFNLKLPMKKRYLTLKPLIAEFVEKLGSADEAFYMQAKHLYHNRDEVTFLIVRNSQWVSALEAANHRFSDEV
uniref:23S rRNA (cytidine(2498)-2'-O)-methyltransferase RlmM n=1 Tax=Ningiella ruwaisensis TaxID=2364274 RepID=UPI00109FF82C|nr:23S rRNA (cytidine(2498)-2'-O)-methyltransferase RlmM [Ningiella ruwaisensis]